MPATRSPCRRHTHDLRHTIKNGNNGVSATGNGLTDKAVARLNRLVIADRRRHRDAELDRQKPEPVKEDRAIKTNADDQNDRPSAARGGEAEEHARLGD